VDLRPLKLFNERVEKLEHSRFLLWLISGPKKPNYLEINDGDWLAYSDLHPDDLTAFCTNLRMLTLTANGFSLKSVSNIYQQLPESFQEGKELIESECKKLNDFLNQKSFIQIEGESDTNEDFFKVILYADIVHGKENHEKKFKTMTSKAKIFSTFTFFHLTNILLHYRNCFSKVADINKVIINHLKT
jgi:hypothetical protein